MNSTFRGDDPSWANACVGNNGQPGAIDYAQGFSAAANLLIERVIENRGQNNYVDEFIYPICFNMRHSVELRLKDAITTLINISSLIGEYLVFDLAGSHDIGNIWSFFKTKSELTDKRYININRKIDSTIEDIAEIDATGQVFRYPTSNENKKHLVDVAVINIFVLRDAFHDLERDLETLNHLNNWLEREYTLGTHTKKLSRLMLYKVAYMLPPRRLWASNDFNVAKEKIKSEFSLSGKDFIKAVDKIKGQHQLAEIIEAPIALFGVEESEIFDFFKSWFKSNRSLIGSDFKDFKPQKITLGSEFIEEMLDDIKHGQKAWETACINLNINILAGLKSLFYFARDKEFVEHYERIYKSYQTSLHSKSIGELKEPYLHLHRKSNAIENILQSLYLLGHKPTAESLINIYKLEKSFSWLERARAGQLYQYPDYADYKFPDEK